MSRTQIVLVGTQYPSYGGAATNMYQLIKVLRTHYNVIGVYAVDEDVDVDPDRIGGIFKVSYNALVYKDQAGINAIKASLCPYVYGKKVLCLCKNYMGPVFARQLFTCRRIYLMAGLRSVITSGVSAATILSTGRAPPPDKLELTAIACSDLVVVNSPLTMNLYKMTYPTARLYAKPVDTSRFVPAACPSGERFIDILVVVSDVSRQEKGLGTLAGILNSPRLANLSTLVVGAGSDKLGLKSVTSPPMTQLTLNETMAHSRLLLVPSLYDSSSNAVREALVQGCQVLVSANVGWADRFPDMSVCKSDDATAWIDKILKLLSNSGNVAKQILQGGVFPPEDAFWAFMASIVQTGN